MSKPKGVLFFGLAEIAIGAITLVAVLASLTFSASQKPLNVLIFVLAAAIISLVLGAGILKYNLRAYRILLFFAAIVILSKILIFARIISLNGALETSVPDPVKNVISLVYHVAILAYFNLKGVRGRFKFRRSFGGRSDDSDESECRTPSENSDPESHSSP